MVGAKRLLTFSLVWICLSAKTLVCADFNNTAMSAVCLQSAVGEPACLIPDLRASLTPEPASFEILHESAVKLEKAADCNSSVLLQEKNSSSAYLKFCQVKVTLPEDVDVAEETQDASGSTNTSGVIETIGCPCYLNQYELFCCPRGESYVLGTSGCVNDTLTPRVHGFEGSIENYYVMSPKFFFSDDYTRIYYSEDGSICVEEWEGHFDADLKYCMYRELNTTSYRILGWIDKIHLSASVEKESIYLTCWLFACMGSASLIALATFVAYSLVPELRNFQGRIVRSYLASYLSSIVFTMVYGANLLPSGYDQECVSILLYCSYACLLWLNVMSFDIWRTFRQFRSSQAVIAKDEQRTTFVRYSIYAWVMPVLPASILEISARTSLLTGNLWLLVMVVLSIFGVVISNIYFYIRTVLKVKRINKDTAQMVDADSKHHQKNAQWINLNVKLFIVMGCPIVLWVLFIAFGIDTFMVVVITVEPLQTMCVFYIFVWKDCVRRSIRERFAIMMRKLRCYRQPDSTPDVQNGNEGL